MTAAMTMRQRAWLVDRAGGIDALRLADAPIPEPGPGEVRIEVQAVGLNPHDVRFLGADHAAAGWPRIPGVDVAGRVEAIGADVTGWRRGARVMTLLDPMRGGGFADFVIARAAALAPVPRTVDAVDAAALPSAGLAAFQAIEERLRPKPGQTLLVYGAGGGVGGYAVQLAVAHRLRIIATFSGHDRDHVLALGAQEVVDWRTDDVTEMVKRLTDGRGVDAIIDVVGRTHATEALALLQPCGAIACTAGLPSLRGRNAPGQSISIHEIAPAAVHALGADDRLRDLARSGQAMLKRLANGNLRSLVDGVVAFDQVPAALRRVMAGEVRGKLVARLRT